MAQGSAGQHSEQSGVLQTKKECQIELAHLKTHKDTARRLRAVVQRESKLQENLAAKQQHISTEMQEYARGSLSSCQSCCGTQQNVSP